MTIKSPGSSSIAPSPFNSFELPIIDKLKGYLYDKSNGPLLTNNEEDLVIVDDASYFDQVSQSAVPKDVMQKLNSGELTRQQVALKMQQGRAVVRSKKSDVYIDRIMTATYAADTCRSLYRVAGGGELVPVEEDDTVETVTHRVGDYVTDLLVAGRERRILKGAAMDRLTTTVRDKFDTNPEAAQQLTVLAGINSMKKIGHYVDELHTVSRGYERISRDSRNKLLGYIASRPIEFQEKPELNQLLANKVKR